MCVACGLPTNHTQLIQTVGTIFLISFILTTFVGAWWVVSVLKTREFYKKIQSKVFKVQGKDK